MTKRRNHDPEEDEVHISQLTRAHPTMDRIGRVQRRTIDSYADRYLKFLDRAKTPDETVKTVRGMINQTEFFGNNRNFMMQSSEDTAFALVKYGRRPMHEGVRIFFAHTDSPCLQLKVKPLLFEWDPAKRDLHLGVELDTFAYGGVHPHQYTGRTLEVRGWHFQKGRKRMITPFNAWSAEISQHTDTRVEDGDEFGEAHIVEDLNIIPGDKSRKTFLRRLGFKREDDFGRARIIAIPRISAARINDHYITGYGQDNSIGVYASVQALIESRPTYTTLVFGFDKEEVGSKGDGGAASTFFEDVFYRALQIDTHQSYSQATAPIIQRIYDRSIAINADVDLASTEREIDNTDPRNIAKFGYGAFVAASSGIFDGEQTPPRLVDAIMRMIDPKKVIYQTVGSVYPADAIENEHTMNEYMRDRGIPTINVSAPAGGLHSPEEISHVGDLCNAVLAYKAIMQDNTVRWERKARVIRRKT